MRVVVINPWITDFKLYDEWMHPMGLYFLISLLRQNGCEVSYLNCLERPHNIPAKRFSTGDFLSVEIPKPSVYKGIPRLYKQYGLLRSDFLERLQQIPRPDAVCVGSGMTYWLPGVARTIGAVKEVWPDVPVIAGGTAATLFPDYLRREFPDIHLFSGAIAGMHGRLTLPVLGTLTSDGPDWSLIDALRTLPRLRHGPVFTSLGCPMACSYCASRLLHYGYETRPALTVIKEMQFLIERDNVQDFAFYDDSLLQNNGKHLTAILDGFSDTDTQSLRLHTPNGMHLQWITEPLLDAMKRGGFITMRFGYESSHKNQSAATSGKSDRTLTAQKLGLLKKHGFEPRHTGIYVMAGLDGQTPADVADDLQFIHSLGVQAKPVFISPVPGTPLFEEYAVRFPQLKSDPYLHNDMFFITQLDGWDWGAAEEIRLLSKKLNSTV